MDEPGAIIERDNLHTLRQHRAIERRDFLFEGDQYFGRILAFAHQHNPGHCLIVFILAHDALARHRAHADLCQVFHQQGRAVTLGHDHMANIVARAQQANAPDQILLCPLLHIAPPSVHIAPPKRSEKLLQRDVQRLHF